MGNGSKRKMLAANEEIVRDFVKIAEKKGRVLYDFTNETLTQAIRAEKMGFSLKEVLDERGIVEAAKEAGFTLVFKRLWYETLEKAWGTSNKKWLLKAWNETGKWFGKLYLSKYPEKALEALKESFRTLMWDLEEIELTKKGDEVYIQCLSASFSDIHTTLFVTFLKGALEALGFEPSEEEISKGIINLKFKVGRELNV